MRVSQRSKVTARIGRRPGFIKRSSPEVDFFDNRYGLSSSVFLVHSCTSENWYITAFVFVFCRFSTRACLLTQPGFFASVNLFYQAYIPPRIFFSLKSPLPTASFAAVPASLAGRKKEGGEGESERRKKGEGEFRPMASFFSSYFFFFSSFFALIFNFG
jgi:hypothetical protein